MSSQDTPAQAEEGSALYISLFVVGGLLLGFGLLNLYWSFGWTGGDFNSDFSQIGFSGLDNISTLPAFDFSLPAVVSGIVCLIFANATAWRKTGGY